MKKRWHFSSPRPWRSGLMITTGLTLLLFGATQFWNTGSAQWAFVLIFTSIWGLLSILLSNDVHIERSNQVLADIVDHNFDQIQGRLQKLESELQLPKE